MASKRDKPPAPIVRKTPRGLSPVSGFFADQIYADADGTEYDLVKRSKRSNPQNGLYWSVLGEVVRATGAWPTAEHLHDDLKLVTGYSRKAVNWETGDTSTIPDSTAFNAMNADQFRVYFDTAMQKLSEHLGYDPLAYSVAA